MRHAWLLVSVVLGCPAAPRATTPGSGLRAATLIWKVGVNQKDDGSALVESILPATFQGKRVWRIVHRDLDPTEAGLHNSYDMYDVDRATGEPMRSIMEREGFHLALTFHGDRVTIEKDEGSDHVRTEVEVAHPRPEGPGEQVLLSSLPLAPGYQTTFPIVDRWAKDEANRVVQIDVAVTGPTQIQTRLGRLEVLEVALTPRNGAFKIREWVRMQEPRFSVKTEYTRGDLHVDSEIVQILIDERPAP